MTTSEHSNLREANVARQAIWCPEQLPDLSFRGVELAGETGEVCNVIKKLERERLGWRGSRDTVAHLAEELADVVICADLCAIAADIDLEAAVEAKFNPTSEKVGLPTRYRRPAPHPEPVEGRAVTLPRVGVVAEIAAGRERQITVEGWHSAHDDQHRGGELAKAAACYAMHASMSDAGRDYLHGVPIDFPQAWDWRWWKPKNRRRDLVRAGALIVAEIERLDRLAEREPAGGQS